MPRRNNLPRPPTMVSRLAIGVELYFAQQIGGDGMVKIGTSRNVERRMRDLREFCPFGVELLAKMPASKRFELKVQKHFAADRTTWEWFKPSPALLEFIEQVRSGADVGAIIGAHPMQTTPSQYWGWGR